MATKASTEDTFAVTVPDPKSSVVNCPVMTKLLKVSIAISLMSSFNELLSILYHSKLPLEESFMIQQSSYPVPVTVVPLIVTAVLFIEPAA